MFTPLSPSMHAFTWELSAALTPWDASIDPIADLVVAVLHDTPANTRKNERMTSRRRSGLTRRAPGSPASAEGLTRPLDRASQPARSPGAQTLSPLTRGSVSAHLYSPADISRGSEGTSSRACAASP